MKFTIGAVNQVGIAQSGLTDKTDLIDWAMLDYIFDWNGSGKAKIVNGMAWFSYKHFMNEMPLIGIKDKSAISRRIKKLKELSLIDTYQDPDDSKIYAKTTAFYYEITKFQAIADPVVLKQPPAFSTNPPVDIEQPPVVVEQHKTVLLNNSNTNKQNNSLSPASEESTIFTRELPPPSANRPTVDKEIENLTILDVVNYLAAMSIALPLEEAQAFIDHFSAQGWYTNGNPIADWRAKARQWHTRYVQFNTKKPNEAARKPVASGSKKSDFHNPPKYSLNDDFGDSSAIDSFAVPVFQIGGAQ